MTEVELRLECLRLAHRPDRSPEAVTQLAKEYEMWVLGPQDKQKQDGQNKPSGKPKKSDNP